MPDPVLADAARLKALFPAVADPPAPDTFEIGLVLGGTVSAGAYTAGALDFLLEALEAWHRDTPRHKVQLKVAGGSSGGAVCAAILGILSSHEVPHIHGTPAELLAQTGKTGNPLWDIWVNQFDLKALLATDDIDAYEAGTRPPLDADTGWQSPRPQHVPALLNVDLIDGFHQQLIDLATQPGQPRSYFAAPFRIAVTVANLRGMPFQVTGVPAQGGFAGAAYRQHDDWAWFAFPNGSNPQSPLPAGKREDEFWLQASDGPKGSGRVGYKALANYATASAAMPIGLTARLLHRPAEHYLYRPKVRPNPAAPDGFSIDWPTPYWAGLTDMTNGEYRCTAVDGGTFNNDPVTLVHRAIAGLVGRNDRDKHKARRAVFMIDPLATVPGEVEPTGRSLPAVLEAIVPAAIKAARYLTADMELFGRDDVFSRFQLVPTSPARQKVGEEALAGASLFAAAGWACLEFRIHDFLLGRANMKAYLAREFVLAGNNPLFARWSVDQRKDFARDAQGERIPANRMGDRGSYFLPILPDRTGTVEAAEVWPVDRLDPAIFQDALQARLRKVMSALTTDTVGGPVAWLMSVLAFPGLSDFAAKQIIGKWRAQLKEAGLLTQ